MKNWPEIIGFSLIAIIGLSVIGWLGNDDYHEAIEADQVHCENVDRGMYYDYKNICPLTKEKGE